MFACWGFPLCVLSDNGPQFASSKFEDYARSCGFTHKTSSPHYHQGNGEAERAVRTVKNMLNQSDPLQALMTYRATPIYATGASPAKLMMGRQPRTRLPTLVRNQETSSPDLQKVREKDETYKESMASHYNKHYNARPLPTLQPGDTARIKTDEQSTWSSPVEVIATEPGSDQPDRSYVVQTPTGNRFRRNRRHIQATPEATVPDIAQGTTETAPQPTAESTPVPRRSGRQSKPVQRLDL